MRPAQYGFHDRLSAEFPSQVVVDITEVCNLACIHCPHPDFKRSGHYAARYLDPELNAKLVDEVKACGQGHTQYIRYTSEGEPLVHPRGYELIEYAVRHSGVYVTLTTNGTILNEKKTQRLIDAGVHLIDISIDAFLPETYARIRVNGDLSITQANVLRLLKWVREGRSKTKVVVSYVEQELNRAETQDFERYWNDQGVDYVVVRRLHSSAGAISEIADAIRKQAGATRKPCLYPWERIILNPRGQLAFCPSDWVRGSEFIDFRTTTIAEVWQGDFYQKLRKAHLACSFEDHGFCGQCPDWERTRWPHEGRSYASMIEEFLENEAKQ